PQDPKISAEAAEAYIVRDHLTKNPDGGVRIRTGLLRGRRQLLIRKDSRGWVHALALDDVVGDESVAQTDDELTAALSAFRSEAGAADGS
ncbi:MAG TPA: hypothetical protein VJ617_08240, partial [Arthrobacter sp.]|nr:hypothetical protein [Arthrobacter sp.]